MRAAHRPSQEQLLRWVDTMLQISTLLQQRSLGYTWLMALRSAINIPSGVIVGVSIVTTDSAPVAVSNISVDDNGLSVIFTQGGSVIASVLTTEENAVVAMDVQGSCISAILETGAFMTSRFSCVPTAPQYIRSSFVTVVNAPQENTLTVTANGSTVSWSNDVSVYINTEYLEYTITDGVLTVKIKAEYKDTFQSSVADTVIQDDGVLYSINGVTPNDDGNIKLQMACDGAPITLVKASPSCIAVSSNISGCDNDNYIDKMISPARSRDYSPEPLDAAYTKEQNGTYTRDYKLLEEATYASYVGGLTLYEINPLHDEVSDV